MLFPFRFAVAVYELRVFEYLNISSELAFEVMEKFIIDNVNLSPLVYYKYDIGTKIYHSLPRNEL